MSPPTVMQMSRNPFAQSNSNKHFHNNSDVINHVVDCHGNIRDQLNTLHAHHRHEKVFNNPISAHCEQHRDALEEDHSGYLSHPNYNQTPPYMLVQFRPCHEIRDIHASKRSKTNYIQPQHYFDQVFNNHFHQTVNRIEMPLGKSIPHMSIMLNTT